mmetsp:Transcript_81432/g.213791  ORF Transcript_81432/g.213791 Transcript_81432/m.213791 type:complete len:227 (+) Transcript_81432:2081-2761(+)
MSLSRSIVLEATPRDVTMGAVESMIVSSWVMKGEPSFSCFSSVSNSFRSGIMPMKGGLAVPFSVASRSLADVHAMLSKPSTAWPKPPLAVIPAMTTTKPTRSTATKRTNLTILLVSRSLLHTRQHLQQNFHGHAVQQQMNQAITRRKNMTSGPALNNIDFGVICSPSLVLNSSWLLDAFRASPSMSEPPASANSFTLISGRSGLSPVQPSAAQYNPMADLAFLAVS